MGVYWALKAAEEFDEQISIVDLRTLAPWDEKLVISESNKHGRVLVLTEESASPSFAGTVQGKIQLECLKTWTHLYCSWALRIYQLFLKQHPRTRHASECRQGRRKTQGTVAILRGDNPTKNRYFRKR